MTRSLAPRAARRVAPNRSPLFTAIVFSLVLGATAAQAETRIPAIGADAQCDANATAADRLDCLDRQAQLHGARLQPANTASVGTPVAPVTAAAETGKPGDPDSWRTEEFEQDWGLGAINAHHAYARGLTGAGIRVGIFDSGVSLKHEEFAGKDHRGLVIGDLLADGSRCAPDYAIAGPDACFGTDGGRPQVTATYWDPALEPYLKPEYAYLLGKLALGYESHGTHVAGTIAANRDGNGMHGVAFGATFNSARLFGDSFEILDINCAFFGQCRGASQGASESAFADMYAQMNAANVRAINHSWGLGREPTTKAAQDAMYNSAANREQWEVIRDGSLAKGMIQVWAAGNTSSVIRSPNLSPIAGIYATLPRYMPELEQYWLSVVNVGETGNAANPYVLSNRSMKCGLSMNWCVAAPGSVITSTVDGGEALIDDLVEDENGNYLIPGIADIVSRFGYEDYSGTSMAAPHVTGALALLFQRYPYLSNPQVRDILLTTATDLGAAGVDDIYGWGLINLKKAIEGYGQFRVDTNVVMNQQAGGLHVWNDARVWDNWTNDIGGPGRLSFDSQAGGWLRLSGKNSFNGLTVKGGVLELTGANTLASDVKVDGGIFMLGANGTLTGSPLTVNGGAAVINGKVLGAATVINKTGYLRGTGTLGNTTVFGTIAPGNYIGTLTINGDYVQKAGSFVDVEIEPPSSNDMIAVSGKATLEGGTVRAIRMPGVFALGQSYNILSAQGGVTGTFAGVDTGGLSPFLGMNLRYGANNVLVDVIRAAALASVAGTANQKATSAALDGLANNNALLQALVMLPDAASANAAFDRLSGELHPTVRGLLADDSRHVRNVALTRARTGQDAFTGQSAGTGFALWADLLSNGGSLEGNANAASARYSGHQMLVGGDYQFDGGWRVGVLGGTGRSDADVGLRASKAEIRSRMIGVYGSQRWGGFGVQGGLSHAAHEIDGERTAAFANFSNGLKSRYDGSTDQAFVEAGYLFGGAAWQIEPYLQYANVRVETDAFTETGGVAALHAGSGESKLDLATGGLRFSLNLKGAQQEQTWLSLRGGLAYRQANGDVTPASAMNFAGSGVFTVQGAPLAKKATLGELGIAARLSERTLLELGYTGQFADEGNDHGANARISVRF